MMMRTQSDEFSIKNSFYRYHPDSNRNDPKNLTISDKNLTISDKNLNDTHNQTINESKIQENAPAIYQPSKTYSSINKFLKTRFCINDKADKSDFLIPNYLISHSLQALVPKSKESVRKNYFKEWKMQEFDELNKNEGH